MRLQRRVHAGGVQGGSHILLKKNPNFWNADNVNLAGVRILFISDATTSLQGYEAGEINVTSILPGAEIPRLLAEDPNFSSEPALGQQLLPVQHGRRRGERPQCAQGPVPGH